MHKLADSLCSILFPTECSICLGEVDRTDGLGVCSHCWLQVESWTGSACARCDLPIVSENLTGSSPLLCGQCRTEDLGFEGARVFGIYRGNLRALILQLKFYRCERFGKRLGALLESAWQRIDFTDAEERPLLVPVPLFHSRERERGFNQAQLLARGLARQLAKNPNGKKAQIAPRLLLRTRSTPPQTGLRLSDRRENVRRAFAVRQPERVRNRAVVLVDDVMTTGATLGACAHMLKQAGASRVYAVALARATPQFPDVRGPSDAGNVDEFRREWT